MTSEGVMIERTASILKAKYKAAKRDIRRWEREKTMENSRLVNKQLNYAHGLADGIKLIADELGIEVEE